MAFALGVFEIGFACSKLFAVAVLGGESPVVLAAWLVSECAALLLVRVRLGNWRAYFPAGDSALFSLFVHTAEYFLMLASPFFILRHPHVLTPCVYTGFVTWTLLGANPLMLALADYLAEGGRADNVEDLRPTILGATTALTGFGAACVFAAMDERYRSTFYKHTTLAMYLRSEYWNAHHKTTLRMKGEVLRGCNHDLVRAYEAIGEYARCYWPMDLVEPFVRENWCVGLLRAVSMSHSE